MVYIILPLTVEGKAVQGIVHELRSDLSSRPHKIIAVVDGINNDTLEALRDLEGDDLVVRTNHIRMGMGATMATGFLTAVLDSENSDDYVVTMEGDQVHSSALINELLKGLDAGNDIVIASRYKAKDGYRNFPFLRKFFSRNVNYLMRKVCPITGVSDYTVFLRAYRMKILNDARQHFGKFGLIQAKGSISNTEILVKLSIFTRRIAEVPFVYNFSRKLYIGNINVLGTINEYIVLILYLKRIFKKIKRFKLLNPSNALIVT